MRRTPEAAFTIMLGRSAAGTATKLMLADMLEAAACRFPSLMLRNVVDDISGTPGFPKMAAFITCHAARLSKQSVSRLDCEHVGADLLLGRWWRARVAKARLRGSGLRAWRVRVLRKAGAYTRKPRGLWFQRCFFFGVPPHSVSHQHSSRPFDSTQPMWCSGSPCSPFLASTGRT